jgi:hypothetical protein
MKPEDDYQPRGRMLLILEAIAAEPERIFTAAECGQIMNIPTREVGSYLAYAIRARKVFRNGVPRQYVYRGTPFPGVKPDAIKAPKCKVYKSRKVSRTWEPDPDDIRIPRVVPGWAPPQMVCPRREVA